MVTTQPPPVWLPRSGVGGSPDAPASSHPRRWSGKTAFLRWSVGTRSKGLSSYDLCQWLTSQGCQAEAYLLLSAGHQPDSDVRKLATAAWRGPKKLILWEQFFEAVEAQLKHPLISCLIPNLKDYYQPSTDYLEGIKEELST